MILVIKIRIFVDITTPTNIDAENGPCLQDSCLPTPYLSGSMLVVGVVICGSVRSLLCN